MLKEIMNVFKIKLVLGDPIKFEEQLIKKSKSKKQATKERYFTRFSLKPLQTSLERARLVYKE